MPAIPSSLGQIVVSQGSPVASMGFSPDTKWLVTGHEDGAFVIWDAATGARANRVDAASTAITRVVFSPGGDLLVTTSADGQVRLWDTGLWRPARKDLLLPRALAIAFSPTGEAFVCAQESGRIGIIRLDGLPSGYLRGHDNPALAAAFGLDGRTLVTGGADNTLRIWDVSGPKAVERRCLGHNDWVERVVVSRGGHVFSSAADHTIRVWDAEKAEAIGQLAEFDVPILDMAADRAGDCVAIANADGAVHVLDAASGREIERLVSPIRSVGATAVAFSPDGKWLAAGFKNGRVEMWSTADWAARKPSRPTTTPVPSAPETLELAQTAKYYDLMRQADELREGAKLDEAAGLYARAAELQPDSVVPLESLGDVYRRMESWQNALGVYRKMLELRPGAISIRLSLCDIQSALGNHEEAIAELQRIVGESPTLATPRLRLGFAYGKMERWPEAADAFKRALELAPESHEAHYGLGLALLKQNQFDAAVASLRRALALNVSEPNTYAALIYCCLSRNPPDIRSARKLVEQAEEAKVALPSALLESLRSPGAQ